MFDLSTVYVTEFCNAAALEWKKGSTGGSAKRPYMGLSVATKGTIIYQSQHQSYVSDRTSLVFLPKNCRYSWVCSEDASVIMINFLVKEDAPCVCPITYKLSKADYIASLAEKVVDASRHKTMHSLAELLAALYAILAMLHQKPRYDAPIVAQAISYIDKNYGSPSLTVKDTAEAVGYSEVYLRRLFAFHCGLSPKKYIHKIRIEAASQMLLESSLSVTEISEKCGFSSLYNFCRLFKDKTGDAPLAYRHKMRSSSDL